MIPGMMNREQRKEKREDKKFVFVSRTVWMLIHVLIPLVLGRFFGIVVERVMYCIVIARLSFDLLDVVEAIDSIETVLIEEGIIKEEEIDE